MLKAYLLLSFFIILFISSCKGQDPSRGISMEIHNFSKPKIITHNFVSKYIGNREVRVWGVETENESLDKNEKYAVLYMHDGQMIFDNEYTWNHQGWYIHNAIEELYKSRKIKKVLVVGINNASEGRHGEFFPEDIINTLDSKTKNEILKLMPNGPQANNYLKFLIEELRPFINENYSVLTDSDNTYMMGSSMGGLISLYALCKYPKIFPKVAGLSTHWIGTFKDNANIPNAINKYLEQNLPNIAKYENIKVYLDAGSKGLDAYYEKYLTSIDQVFKSKSFDSLNYMSKVFEGADHTETNWANRVKIPLLFLIQ